MNRQSFRSPLARAVGLGSAKKGYFKLVPFSGLLGLYRLLMV